MDRKTIIGFVLIATLLTVWMTWNSKKGQLEAEVKKRHDDSIERVNDSVKRVDLAVANSKKKRFDDSIAAIAAKDTLHQYNPDSIRNAQRLEAYGVFKAASKGENKTITLENEKMKISILSKGGRIGQVELKGIKTWDGKPLILFGPDSSHFGIAFFDKSRRRFNTDSLYFSTDAKDVNVSGNDSGSVSMRLYTDSAKTNYIEYLYSLRGNTYMAGFVITFSGANTILADDQSSVDLEWTQKAPSQEKSLKNQQMVSTVSYLFDGEEEVEHLSVSEAETKPVTGELKWVSFRQQYFSSILIAGTHFTNGANVAVNIPSDPFHVKGMSTMVPVPFGRSAKESFPMRFYFGPNEYSELKSHGLHLENQIDLGWNFFGTLNRYVFIPLFSWLGDVFPNNYGLVILLLTIIVKIVLFPIAYKSFLSSAKMRVLKPEMDVLNEKFKEDPMKKQQATMEMYRKAGVNPAAGCIPLLLQIPILFALIRLFPGAYELRQQAFLWANDLSTYDSVWNFGFEIPFYGDHMSLFALLMTVSTLLYTWMNQQMLSPGSTQLPGMKWLIYLMPVMFLGFLNSYSAALSYYYFVSNIITFGQMYAMRRFVDEGAIRAKIEENKKKPAKKSGLMARLEAAQRERQKQLNESKNPKKKK
jgi:YidC/Oxa1 family membrane protein insertase